MNTLKYKSTVILKNLWIPLWQIFIMYIYNKRQFVNKLIILVDEEWTVVDFWTVWTPSHREQVLSDFHLCWLLKTAIFLQIAQKISHYYFMVFTTQQQLSWGLQRHPWSCAGRELPRDRRSVCGRRSTRCTSLAWWPPETKICTHLATLWHFVKN